MIDETISTETRPTTQILTSSALMTTEVPTTTEIKKGLLIKILLIISNRILEQLTSTAQPFSTTSLIDQSNLSFH
jgi:hypothetical protein